MVQGIERGEGRTVGENEAKIECGMECLSVTSHRSKYDEADLKIRKHDELKLETKSDTCSFLRNLRTFRPLIFQSVLPSSCSIRTQASSLTVQSAVRL